MKINFNGIEITLTTEASAENYGTNGSVVYTADGVDSNGNKYSVTWNTTAEWNEANEEGVDEDGDPVNSYCNDESNACDWDNPESVTMTHEAK
ncbi:MAG: hypothetical protein WC547_01115 [Candidatus Omnitrophota bacterium]